MNTKIIAIAVLLLVGLPLVTYVMHYVNASANVVANEIEPSVIEQSRSLTFDEKDQGAPQGAFFIACQKNRGMTHDHVTWHSNDHRRTSRHPAHPGRTLPELASSKRALKKSLSRRCGARTPLSRRPAAAKSSARCGPSTTRPGGLAA